MSRRSRRRIRALAGAGLGATAALGVPAAADGATFTVTTKADPFPFDGACDSHCTLREAFQLARDNGNSPAVDRVLFASHVTGTLTLNGTQLPFVNEPLELVGPGADRLAISGAGQSRIINIDPPVDSDIPVTIAGLKLTRGQTGDSGGAIRSEDAALVLRSSTVSGNVMSGESQYGGAIYLRDGLLTLDRVTIAGNAVTGHRGGGGGIGLRFAGLTSSRSTISGNRVTHSNSSGGGAILGRYVYPVELKSTTVASNSSVDGTGGIDTDGTTLVNSIVANNIEAGAPNDSEGSVDASFSLVEAPQSSLIQSVPGSNLTGVDPKLGTLAFNRGPTPTHAPKPTSPVIDRGRASGTDQRGIPRPFDFLGLSNSSAAAANGADIGAVEIRGGRCRGRNATLPSKNGLIGGTPRRDVIVGTRGPNRIRARGGRDLVCAGAGRDRVLGGAGLDLLLGQGGPDRLLGGGGPDRLLGGPGRDLLLGGGGPDRLLGGPGRDLLLGGPGRDRQRQ